MRTQAKVVGAWGVGVAVGFATAVMVMGSGCFAGAFAIAKAAADDTVTTPCATPGQVVTYDLPDTTPETFARLSVVQTKARLCDGATTITLSQVTASATDGKVTATCPSTIELVDCHGHQNAGTITSDSFTFSLR